VKSETWIPPPEADGNDKKMQSIVFGRENCYNSHIMALSRKELAILNNLLKKVKPTSKGVPEEVFEGLIHLVPFIALEIVVVNKKGEMLLTWRDDKYWRGWHFPGGLLRYRETFKKRLNETVKRELGTLLKSFRFLFTENYLNGKRSHDVSLVFKCVLSGKPKDGKFFGKMPKDIIDAHKVLWKNVTSNIKF